ncbi:unnamed protein product [Schistosoma mattheei]|uniref:Uncharacterized protein n=1 Tax=Schistosoma mattheei TaxID=31246 RepID=A0A183PZV1_9TREM|nr:unnamed protein product [Schistosoma mattheei]
MPKCPFRDIGTTCIDNEAVDETDYQDIKISTTLLSCPNSILTESHIGRRLINDNTCSREDMANNSLKNPKVINICGHNSGKRLLFGKRYISNS